MEAARALAPGAHLAPDRPYLERAERTLAWADKTALALHDLLWAPLQRLQARRPARTAGLVAALSATASHLVDLDDTALKQELLKVRRQLRAQGLAPAAVQQSLALVQEVAARELGLRAHAPQLLAASALIQGRLVEMATGEGKSLVAALAASCVALAGLPVHVVTVNDYLSARDAEQMAPLFTWLGLSVGLTVPGEPRPQRQAAYARDICFCSSKELAFDYLRDRCTEAGRQGPLQVALERAQRSPGMAAPEGTPAGSQADRDLVLRGLVFALVDEADSVFIDEARTPLILSATPPDLGQQAQLSDLLAFAATLQAGEHFSLEPGQHQARLLPAGVERLDAHAQGLEGWWNSARAREEWLLRALAALHVYRRDEHYVVTEGKVQIVDESTGRVMPDRAWQHGLHTLVELKEGLDTTPPRETLARLTFQRLFRRYLRLAGMTGTAWEVAAEIQTVYRLPLLRVPLARPSRRQVLPRRLCRTEADKWQRVAERIRQVAMVEERAVLVGTRSVRASEALSAVLHAQGVAHELLNAKQDQEEARIVALAGQPGRVTVATNMAGRGTDIRLHPDVAARGGLHVILTEHHDSRRVDRQLQGRCARQNDPGSTETIVALDDELYRQQAPALAAALQRLARRRLDLSAQPQPAGPPEPDPPWLRGAATALTHWAQRRAEARHARVRRQTLAHDLHQRDLLAFAGRAE